LYMLCMSAVTTVRSLVVNAEIIRPGHRWCCVFLSALTLLVGRQERYQVNSWLCHLPPKILFQNKWRKKLEGEPAYHFHLEMAIKVMVVLVVLHFTHAMLVSTGISCRHVSVCLSQVSVLLKQLNVGSVGSCKRQHTIAHGL